MPPHIPDEWDGHPYAKADARVPDAYDWELHCLLTVCAAHASGDDTGFRFPVSCFHEARNER